jgi:hypothetical protein
MSQEINTLKIMAEVRKSVIDYLQDELEVNTAALKAYDPNAIDDEKRDPEVKRYREIEAIKLRDRVNELTRHIKVIKRMYPDA